MMETPLSLLGFGLWCLLWAAGGWWLARAVFTLARGEALTVGLAVGLVLETLAANLLGQWLAPGAAFWLAAGLVFAAGLALTLPRGWRRLLAVPGTPGLWLALLGLTGLAFLIGRGLAIFDDWAHLPVVSMLAAGGLPPRFPLDPSVRYDYHYFLLLAAAQGMRIGGLAPWKALDLVRAFSLALALALTYQWTLRLTASRAAGWLGALMLAFSGGTRWLLLLLPTGLLQRVSGSLTLIGSGVQSGPELTTALLNQWMMEGGGPQPLLFAFANGLRNPGVISLLGANGLMGRVLPVVLLLTFNRWRSRWALPVSALLVSAAALMTETGVLLDAAAWGLVLALYLILRRRWPAPTGRGLPAGLWGWLVAAGAGTLLGFLQGGALHGVLRGKLAEFLLGEELASYQTMGFHLAWPPEIVSAHLGAMSLANPYQVLAALAEMGPVLVALPWVAAWGWRALRAGRWYEAVTIFSGLISLPLLLLQFTGSTGVRNTGRLYAFLGTAALFAVPALWRWAARRGELWRGALLSLALASMVGGAALFSTELVAAGKPVTTFFVTPLDVRAMEDHWDRLAPGALVFDATPWRAATLFGRGQDAAVSWYQFKPAWNALRAKPDPRAMRAAGFRYLYYDELYKDELPKRYQALLEDACGVLLGEYTGPLGQYRRLVDIGGCE